VANNTIGKQQFTQEELDNYKRLTQGVTDTDLARITPNFNIRGGMNDFLKNNKLQLPSLDLGVSPDKVKFNKPTPSFLESLSTNPMLGSSLSLNDKFTIAGMSSAFDPSFIGDKNLQDKVSGVNKFTGAAALTSGIFGATKSFLAGRGIQNQNSEFMSDYFKNMKELNEGSYQYREDGGIGIGTGMGMVPNAEVEDGEYIITPEQEMMLVEGRTHEEGGEPVRFNGGERIISDNLKVGAKTAKELRKQTGLDINLTDTYATVVDKYSKKLGLNKVDEEIKKYYKEIDEIKKSQDENTKRINLQFLQKQLLEKEARKQQLEQEKIAFADEMFNRQEMSKAPTKKFENGGQFNLADLASQYGMSEEEIMYLLSSQQQQQFDDVGEFIRRPNFVSTLPPLSNQRTSQLPGLYGVTKAEYLQEIEKLHPEEYNKFLAGDKYKNKSNVQAYQKAINSKYDNYISEIKGKVTDEVLRYKYISQIEAEKFKEAELAKGFDGLLGEFTSSRPAFNLQNIGNNTGTVNTVVDSNKVDPLANIKGLNLRDFRKKQSNLFIPQQYNIPPQGMLPHAKRELRLETIDPIAISPDAQLRELNRAQELSNEALEFLPVGLRASTQANTTANLMSEYSKAISAANLFNQQNAQNVEQQNVQTRNVEENFRVGEIPRYEQMQLTAEAKTMNDIYNYFNTGMRNEVNKYNYMTKARILDSLFQNVGYDAMGNPVVDPNTMLPFEFGEARNVVQPSSYTTDPYSKKSKNSSKTKEKGK
jgi:uncharacterized protein YidB (DUF937 family)